MISNRDLEVELVHALSMQSISFTPHFLKDSCSFIDNINGGFDSCKAPIIREGGVGERFGTWSRARAIAQALTLSFQLHPILGFNAPTKSIKGLGISDDHRYANMLEYLFDYQNTHLHKPPFLDVMVLNSEKLEDKVDFIICSDVLEHVIGNWRIAINNLFQYINIGGVLILTVPWDEFSDETLEHYPDCISYNVLKDSLEYTVEIITSRDISYIDETPIFHGGPGNTLEMRVFSLKELIRELGSAGFREVSLQKLDSNKFGIGSQNEPGVLIAKK